MSNTLTKNAFAMPEPFLGSQQFRSELLEIKSTKVLEFAPLEQIPHPFLRIQREARSQAIAPDECVWLLLVSENS